MGLDGADPSRRSLPTAYEMVAYRLSVEPAAAKRHRGATLRRCGRQSRGGRRAPAHQAVRPTYPALEGGGAGVICAAVGSAADSGAELGTPPDGPAASTTA